VPAGTEITAEPLASVRLDHERAAFSPEEVLAGEYRVEARRAADILSVELSVLWYTAGKGDEDLVVTYFERLENDDGQLDLTQPRRFSTPLPASPLSYDGVIVKVYWCVRVRVFLRNGKEVCIERPFQVGNVPSAHPVEDE
jgi:hypothetical protein